MTNEAAIRFISKLGSDSMMASIFINHFPGIITFDTHWPQNSPYHNSKFTDMTGFQMDKAQANLKETHSQIQGMLVSNSTITIDVRSKLQAIQELASSISRDVATLLNNSPQLSHNLEDMNIPETPGPSMYAAPEIAQVISNAPNSLISELEGCLDEDLALLDDYLGKGGVIPVADRVALSNVLAKVTELQRKINEAITK